MKKILTLGCLVVVAFMASGSAFITQDRGTYDETMEIVRYLERMEARAAGIRERISRGQDTAGAEEELDQLLRETGTRAALAISRLDDNRRRSGIVASYITSWYQGRIRNALQRVQAPDLTDKTNRIGPPRTLKSSPNNGMTNLEPGSDHIPEGYLSMQSSINNENLEHASVSDEDSKYASVSDKDAKHDSGKIDEYADIMDLTARSEAVSELAKLIEGEDAEQYADSPSFHFTAVLRNAWDDYPQTGLSLSSTVIEYAHKDSTQLVAAFKNDSICIGPVAPLSCRATALAGWLGGALIHGEYDTGMETVMSEKKQPFIESEQKAGKRLFYTRPGELRNRYSSRDHIRLFAVGDEEVSGDYHTDSLKIKFSSGIQVEYDFDEGRYVRFVNNRPHVDALTKSPVSFESIVLMKISEKQADDGPEEFTGFGTALVFHNGRVINGVWLKDETDKPASLYDRLGRPVTVNPGNLMLTMLDSRDKVSYISGYEMASL